MWDMKLRLCSDCLMFFPPTSDYFPKAGKEGLSLYCKDCYNKRARIARKIKEIDRADKFGKKANSANRAARHNRGKGKLTSAEVKAKYNQQRGLCAYCLQSIGKDYHLDHIHPISRGGVNLPINIVIACPQCNISKRDRTVDEWLGIKCKP